MKILIKSIQQFLRKNFLSLKIIIYSNNKLSMSKNSGMIQKISSTYLYSILGSKFRVLSLISKYRMYNLARKGDSRGFPMLVLSVCLYQCPLNWKIFLVIYNLTRQRLSLISLFSFLFKGLKASSMSAFSFFEGKFFDNRANLEPLFNSSSHMFSCQNNLRY